MLKITDKKRAKYLLEVHAQGGHKFFHFIRTNKKRYIFILVYFGICTAFSAYVNLWFVFVLTSFIFGALIGDIGWFRSMQKSWPFISKVVNWDEVKKVADE